MFSIRHYKVRHTTPTAQTRCKGFTLIELLIAAAVFSIIAVFATGSLVIIFGSSRKSNAVQAVMTNLNFALENMSREIRFGQVYHCGSGAPTVANDCMAGSAEISFKFDEDDDGVLEDVYYRFTGSDLERRVGSSGAWQVVVSNDVRITSGRFYVLGSSSTDTEQPRVRIILAGQAGRSGTASESSFYLQNTLVQRIYDQ